MRESTQEFFLKHNTSTLPLYLFIIEKKKKCRGRGSRALLKWFRDGVLIHDASYHVAVQLEGPEVDTFFRFLLQVFPKSSHSAFLTEEVAFQYNWHRYYLRLHGIN